MRGSKRDEISFPLVSPSVSFSRAFQTTFQFPHSIRWTVLRGTRKSRPFSFVNNRGQLRHPENGITAMRTAGSESSSDSLRSFRNSNRGWERSADGLPTPSPLTNATVYNDVCHDVTASGSKPDGDRLSTNWNRLQLLSRGERCGDSEQYQ